MKLPVLLAHDFARPIGSVECSPAGRALVSLQAHPLTREEFFDTFGQAGALILETITTAGVERIVRAELVEFSIVPLGAKEPT